MGSVTNLKQLFFRTLRDDPSSADATSHKLLVRAGYIRQTAPGIFTWLPLGLRVLRKVEAIINEEMQAIGCEEVHFPALLPREPFEQTNRWTEYGPNIFRLKDRRENDYLLAPTHEEMFTLLVKDMFSSYKDLPVMLYQIQTKYRDEARPRAGLLRGREFIMKDAYSFDIEDEGLAKNYQLQRAAYQKIFERLGLPFVIAKAMSGAMGGSMSEEFLSPTAVGEDTFVVAPSGYAANVEAAEIMLPEALNDEEIAKLPAANEVHTPDAKTIEAVTSLLGATKENALKSVILKLLHPDGSDEVIVIGVPGDRDVDEKRVEATFAPSEVVPADADDIKKYPEIVPGFCGPFNSKNVKYYVDSLVVKGTEWVSGANKIDYHTEHLVAGRDFALENVISVATIREGDLAADGSGPLKIERGVEIGHIFALGRKYTEALDLKVQSENGKLVTPTMGSYGIGVTRAVALLAENYNDDMGLAWPKSIAPADVHIVIARKDEDAFTLANKLAQELADSGLDVFLDDRDGKTASPGVKLKDAELIGVPVIVVLGRGLDEDTPNAEVKLRNGDDLEKVGLDNIVPNVLKRFENID